MSGKFSVGDKVIVEGSYNENRYGANFWEDTVEKVARKYFYLHGDGNAYELSHGPKRNPNPPNERPHHAYPYRHSRFCRNPYRRRLVCPGSHGIPVVAAV